jgi:hypothetical protein
MKRVMAVYTSLGDAMFWRKYSRDGKRLAVSQIRREIFLEARTSDASYAAFARNIYGETFQQHFSYRRGRQIHILSKPEAIARRYRLLTSTNPVV